MSLTPQTTYSDRGLYQTVMAAVVLFVLAAPVCLYMLEGVSATHRLWVAFLGANLVACGGMLTAATVREVRRLAEAGAQWTRRSESTQEAGGGDVALEA